jgi:hypothetical protein
MFCSLDNLVVKDVASKLTMLLENGARGFVRDRNDAAGRDRMLITTMKTNCSDDMVVLERRLFLFYND